MGPVRVHGEDVNTSQKPQPLDRLAFLTKERVPGPEEGYQPIAEPAREPPLRAVVALGRQHLPVVLALLLGVALIGFHALTRSSATEVPAAPVRESSPASATASASASATPQPRQLRVHVLGAVVNPGVVRLPEGSIVEDAIEAAGGLRPDAAPGELNLAAVIQDGQQIIIGDGSAPRGEVVASTTAASGGVLDLNSATAEQLESLPGVGPVLAADIVAWRDEHGPFTDVAQLQEVSGVGPRTYERLAPLVRV
ncbi:ComEA family DNA-binding protein [Arachnia propionica]|uniref:ComEA family DNA-binding protein n=1 Tax=Arachnia propionica TaxID=1750 RepID=A0A3P1X134_9ACTN|nr:ComEA family DNA-binding protein [Arachnia propionica]